MPAKGKTGLRGWLLNPVNPAGADGALIPHLFCERVRVHVGSAGQPPKS